jgi:hypothetical protein
MSLGVGLQLQADWVAEQDEGQITHFYTRGTRVAIRTGSSTLNYLLGDHLGSQDFTANSSGKRTGRRPQLAMLPASEGPVSPKYQSADM